MLYPVMLSRAILIPVQLADILSSLSMYFMHGNGNRDRLSSQYAKELLVRSELINEVFGRQQRFDAKRRVWELDKETLYRSS